MTEPEPEPVVPEDPRDDIPGPDVVADVPPTIDELPEPVVIEADDTPGEAFHHEPKAAGRVSEHEGFPGDREERDHYEEEIVLPVEEDQPPA